MMDLQQKLRTKVVCLEFAPANHRRPDQPMLWSWRSAKKLGAARLQSGIEVSETTWSDINAGRSDRRIVTLPSLARTASSFVGLTTANSVYAAVALSGFPGVAPPYGPVLPVCPDGEVTLIVCTGLTYMGFASDPGRSE